MTQTKKKSTSTKTTSKSTKNKSKRKISRASIIIIVGLIIILVPCLIFGWILLSSAMQTGTPVIGDRFKDDLNPAITSTEISAIEKSVGGITGVDKVDVELKTATLRVYVDTEDSYNAEQIKSIANQAYASVTGVCDPNTYFTQHDNMKMYDLEIHVYNLSKDRDSDSFAYVIATRTSNMAEPTYQLVSEPIDAELAQQLRDDVENRNNPTPTPDDTGDITVGSGDSQANPEDGGEAPEETEGTE